MISLLGIWMSLIAWSSLGAALWKSLAPVAASWVGDGAALESQSFARRLYQQGKFVDRLRVENVDSLRRPSYNEEQDESGIEDEPSEEEKRHILETIQKISLVENSWAVSHQLVLLVAAVIYSENVATKRRSHSTWDAGSWGEVSLQLHHNRRERWLSAESRGSSTEDFRTPLFGCFENMDYCLYGCFLLPLRFADTAQAGGVWRYWNLVFGYFAFHMLGIFIPMGWIYYWVLPALFCSITRARLRGAIGRNPTMDLRDFASWCCCWCCAAIQEAREIDMELQVAVLCCCRIVRSTDNSITPLVGQPVEALSAAAGDVEAPQSAPLAAPAEAYVAQGREIHVVPAAAQAQAAQAAVPQQPDPAQALRNAPLDDEQEIIAEEQEENHGHSSTAAEAVEKEETPVEAKPKDADADASNESNE